MSRIGRYSLTDEAMRDAEKLLARCTPQIVLSMLENSTVASHPKGNRRYKNYVFKVHDGLVLSMDKYEIEVTEEKTDCEICGGTGKLIAYEVCESCDGAGCKRCHQTGELRKERNCTCRTSPKGRGPKSRNSHRASGRK